MVNFNILSKFNGIAAIGDIHGNAYDMKQAIAYCKAGNLFFLSLGDLTDYGSENYECVKLMHGLIQHGSGAMVIGNHDDKMRRYLIQRHAGQIRVQIKGGLVATTDELELLTPDELADFSKKFLEIINKSKHHYVLSNTMFVHAAAHPKMWLRSELSRGQKSRALYGEIDRDAPKRSDGFPNRIYNWVQDLDLHLETIPKIVVVGHDVRNHTSPVIHDSLGGGMAIFVDTGSSKGGKLSLVSFEIKKAGDVSYLSPLDFKTFGI